MAPERIRLTGVDHVVPLRQGDLSNLCGLYAVLNAVHLACWRLRPSNEQLRQILQFGFRYLTRRRLLAKVVALGMESKAWTELSSALIDYSNELLATSLVLRPLGTDRIRPNCLARVSSIKKALSSGSPVLCGLGGALEHYTVIAGYSTTRLILFDSSDLRWIEQNSLGTSEQCGKRHWLYPDSASAIVDAW